MLTVGDNKIRTVNYDGEEFVVLNELAPLIGYQSKARTPSSKFQNWLQFRGFETRHIKAKLESGKTQYVLAMFAKDVDDVIALKSSDCQSAEDCQEESGNKIFYVFQMFAKKHPDIVVMGVTTQGTKDRLRQYQSNQRKVLREYQLKSLVHEATLIDMISKGYEKLSREIVSVDDIDSFLLKSDQIVSLLS